MLFDSFFKKNVIWVTVVQVTVALSFFFLIGSIAHTFPKEEVGLYGNFRGIIQIFFVLYIMGLDMAMARYLGTYSDNPESQKEIFSTVLVLFTVFSVSGSIILFFLKDFFTEKFLSGDYLIFFALVFLMFSLGIYKIVYTFYQGKKEIAKANFLQFFVYAFGNVITGVLVFTGVLTSIASIAFILGIWLFLPVIVLVKLIKENFVFKFRFKEIANFSIPRSIHVLLSGTALSSSILLATYFYSYSAAADFTVTSRILRIIDMLAYAFNIIFMPIIAEKVSRKEFSVLKNSLSPYQDLILFFGLAGGFAVFVLSDLLVLSWLPDSFKPAVYILKLISPGFFFYFYYVMFRSIIHSAEEKPLQLYIDIAAIVILFSVFYFGYSNSLSAAIAISTAINSYFFVKALLSHIFLKKLFSLEWSKKLHLTHIVFILLCVFLYLVSPVLSAVVFLFGEGLLFYKSVFPVLKSIK